MAQPIDGITRKNAAASEQMLNVNAQPPVEYPPVQGSVPEDPYVEPTLGAQPPKRQRISRKVKAIGAIILLVVVLAVLGWVLKDHLFAQPTATPSPTVVSTPTLQTTPTPTPIPASPSPSPLVHHAKVLTDSHIRSTPDGTANNVTATIPAGTVVVLKDPTSSGGWYHVIYTTTNGTQLDGYVAASSLSVVD